MVYTLQDCYGNVSCTLTPVCTGVQHVDWQWRGQ